MTTVINSPGTSSSSVVEIVLGFAALVGIIVLFIVYALPAIRNMANPSAEPSTTINVEVPVPAAEASPISAP